MSRRNENVPNVPKLNLELKLSPPRVNPHVQVPRPSSMGPPISPPSSCVSSEFNQEDTHCFSNSPDAIKMKVVGCPRCFMYIMIAEQESRCPRCNSTDVIDKFTGSSSSTVPKTQPRN